MRIFKILELLAITLLVLAFVTKDIAKPTLQQKVKFTVSQNKADSKDIIAVR
jgi:hypothetical protein